MSTRQEIYDRIRESSKDEYILEEMIRLGFWPRQEGTPKDPAEDIRRTGELERQLRALTTENSRLQNIDAIKKAARKQRMAESRQKQKETKERRLKEREEKAAAWQEKKATEIVYLGADVSNSLNQQEVNDAKLATRSLPKFNNVSELAAAMDIPVGELRFLAFDRRTSTTTHYRRFGIAKKTGGIRTISAPMPRLKRAQEWILQNVLEKVELHRAAHGFRRGRSIVTNAQPHVNSDVVINVDIQDFFPTVTFPRIRGVFKSLGYSGQLATILALICSEPDRDEVELDGRTFFVAKTERRLPQGAPSSPALTNIICRGLDARLDRTAEKLGFRYTRYADDITFSGSGDAMREIGRALRRIGYIVEQEGFSLHPDKTRVLRSSNRQEVTGLVVNEKIAVKRELLRRFRALLFHIDRDGPAGKSWGSSMHVMTSIEGFANFVAMVDAEKGAELQSQVRALHSKHGKGQSQYPDRQRWQPPEPPVPETSVDAVSAEGLADSQRSSNRNINAQNEDPFQTASFTGAPSPLTPQDLPSSDEQPPKRKKPWWKFW